MPKKVWTEEERKAFGDKMRALREKKSDEVLIEYPSPDFPEELPKEPVTDTQPSQELDELRRQVSEIMETNALLKAALLRGDAKPQGVQVGTGGRLIGEVDKYLIDPDNYPDPTKRLTAEQRLETIAFRHNYELDYEFRVRSYETKTGVNMREPEFTIRLLRIVLDDQGNRVKILKDGKEYDKMYVARRFVFHEDPQAAMAIARENNIAIEAEDEKVFLDEMRYLRIRDWLFDFFWRKQPARPDNLREEAIGGTVVQVVAKSTDEPSAVDFDQIKTKM